MSLVIQSNLAALRARRHLDRQTRDLNRVYERLSSGLRLNQAADDAAGTSIVERLNTQVRGLGQVGRNTQDGLSLLQVAEASLSESTSILQRVRELAVQSASDVNTSADREALQAEVDQLLGELDRVAQTTRLNGESLLDGNYIDKHFHVGTLFRESIRFSIADARSSSLGRWAVKTGEEVFHNRLLSADLIINGVTIRRTQDSDDKLSTTLISGSAIAKAAAINDSSEFHGVKAYTNPALHEGSASIGGGSLDLGNQLIINGRRIAGFEIQADDSDGALRTAINAEFEHTGVIAHLNEQHRLKLRAEDGRNIDIVIRGGADLITGLETNTRAGRLTLHSEELIQLSGVNEVRAGFTDNDLIAVNSSQATNTLDIRSRADANLALLITDRALEQLNAQRAYLGALSNRLGSTQAHISAMEEQMHSTRSRIQDADFALESAELSRKQVLQQAANSILAQANQQPQIALSLLQG